MSVYFITVFLVFLFCYWAQKYDYKTVDTTSTEKTIHTSSTKIFFIFVAIVLIFVAGFRYYVGTDYGGYYNNYKHFADEFFEFCHDCLRVCAVDADIDSILL